MAGSGELRAFARRRRSGGAADAQRAGSAGTLSGDRPGCRGTQGGRGGAETLDYLCARNRTEFERIEVAFYYVSECGEDTCALLEAAVEWDKSSDVSVELTRCSRSELLQRHAELERPDGLLDRGEAML